MMATHPHFGSPTFKLVVQGVLALHRLIEQGQDDSPEADSVRDALDAPLRVLNRTEKDRAQWLSEDLFSVSEPAASTTLNPLNPQALQELMEAIRARDTGEWDRALALLRKWRDHIPPALLSELRGSIWWSAGYSDVAAAFLQHAAELDRTNIAYQELLMHALADCDPVGARMLARQVLEDSENCAPILVARAADIRYHDTRTSSIVDSARIYRELIPVLERNVARIEEDPNLVSRASAYATTILLLGSCYEHVGEARTAGEYYTRGLRENPQHLGLLVKRGILMYGVRPSAISDFEQAVRLDSPLVWPYLFLAHHYLITSQLDQCRAMCDRGLRMPGSNMAKSQLQEWLAIAQAELGFSPERVREAFEAAIRSDPTNDLAQRNQRIFEEYLRMPQTPLRSRWQQKSERELRLFGLAESRCSQAA